MLIGETQLRRFIEEVSDQFEVFVPGDADGHSIMTRFVPGGTMSLRGCRTTEPLKTLLYPPREQLLPFVRPQRKRLIIGARNCDLAALAILDRALLGADFVDPGYRARRELTYIAAVDCTDPLPTCHCNLLGLEPYPESGYDLSLSPVQPEAYRLRAATAKGEEIAAMLGKYAEAGEDDPRLAEEIAANRERVRARLAEGNADYARYRFTDAGDAEAWTRFAGECVECGACNYICPTCYCMVMNDETEEALDFRKIRAWDSCQHTGYARVAGGANPRSRLWQRFRHRYHCKFAIMNDQFSLPGCTGCGRCIAACPGGIDLRQVVGGS